MIIERTRDMALVKRVMGHPKVYDKVSDDLCPSAEDYSPVDSDHLYYLAVYDNERFCGIVFLHPVNFFLYQGHIALLPDCLGVGTQAIEMACDWMKKNTECLKIIAFIPVNNRLAFSAVSAAGFKEACILENSIKVDGKVINQHLMEKVLWVE